MACPEVSAGLCRGLGSLLMLQEGGPAGLLCGRGQLSGLPIQRSRWCGRGSGFWTPFPGSSGREKHSVCTLSWWRHRFKGRLSRSAGEVPFDLASPGLQEAGCLPEDDPSVGASPRTGQSQNLTAPPPNGHSIKDLLHLHTHTQVQHTPQAQKPRKEFVPTSASPLR